jgi:peptide/nickel transport system substrate-binding protein
MRLRSKFLSLAATLALSVTAVVPQASAQAPSILRMVANTELQVLDPIATPSVITRAFGYMVWDTLVAVNSKGEPKPQMLESWTISPDGNVYTFKLRAGLLWSDGTPVTSDDCIASLKRWGGRDGVGRQLIAATKEFRKVDDRTFELHLGKPFGHVIEAIGKAAALVPFMMPARIANTPPTTIIQEIVGSGPFIFRREEWRPGDRVVFHKNTRYAPRDEPADGLSGGKRVYFDRVEFVSIPDASTRVNALTTGDIDYLERVPPDFITRLQRDRRLVVTQGRGGGSILGLLTLNHTQPPLNNIKVRQAIQMAVSQPEVVASLGYPANMVEQTCLSIYMCGFPASTDAGSERFREPNLDRAKALLREAGYNNEPIVVLHSTDSVLIDPISLVAIEQMKRLGLNVDVKTADWSTVAQMRTKRDPVAQGGWSVVPIVWTGWDMSDPLVNPALAYNCAEAYPGWWCDRRQVPVMAEYLTETDPAKRRAIAARLQELAHDNANIILLGQVAAPAAYRSNLTGMIDIGFPIAWNVRRTN